MPRISPAYLPTLSPLLRPPTSPLPFSRTTASRPPRPPPHRASRAAMSAAANDPAVPPPPPSADPTTAGAGATSAADADAAAAVAQDVPAATPEDSRFGYIRGLLARRSELKADMLRRYGVAALLSYGLFDAVTYAISFALAARAYVAAGKVLTWGTLPQVLALMWGVNNLSRPFRIAGAIALAPAMDRKVVKPIGRAWGRVWHRIRGKTEERCE